MANLNFKLNPNQSAEKQIDLLNSILDKISSLDNRISNIEKTPRNDSFHCSATDLQKIIEEKAKNISTAISNIKTDSISDSTPDVFLDKMNDSIIVAFDKLKSHTTKLVFGATFFITCWLAAFVWWFWDVPAQIQAVNNYAYQQTEKEKAAQNAQ